MASGGGGGAALARGPAGRVVKRRGPEPPPPPERHATVRAELEVELRKDHLEHVEQSARTRGERLVVEAASCADCGFRFEGRTRLTKPGACPECRSTRIDPPLFSLAPG